MSRGWTRSIQILEPEFARRYWQAVAAWERHRPAPDLWML